MYWLELAGQDDAFAAAEAATAAAGVDVLAPGLATATSVDADHVSRLAYTHRANELVGRTTANVTSARALVEAASLSREGSVAVRARNVRSTADVSTREAEIELGGVLVERGFTVDLDDPDHLLRVCFADDVCLVGWQVVESVRDYGERLPGGRPFFQPGSMNPMDARALVNLAGGVPGARILDPMVGTGGILIEAGLVGAAVVGVDAQYKMVHGARENLDDALGHGMGSVVRGDATALPFRDETFDGVVFDAPYGRQSKIEGHGLRDLVAGALSEAGRVSSRTVLLADRSWAAVAREAGWTVEATFERRVHRSLVRHVHVLSRS